MQQYLLIFVLIAANNFAWILYVMGINKNRAFQAALAITFILIFNNTVSFNFTNNHWHMATAIVTSFSSTYLILKKWGD